MDSEQFERMLNIMRRQAVALEKLSESNKKIGPTDTKIVSPKETK
jgi:hypothetical protein